MINATISSAPPALRLSLIGMAAALALFAIAQVGQAVAASALHSRPSVAIAISPQSTLLALDNAAPGDSVTKAVVVSNTGGLELRYAVASSTSGGSDQALASALALTIRAVDVTTPNTPCDNFDGALLYHSGIAAKLIGDSAQGAQPGDRTLVAGSDELLCFRASLADTANVPQAASTMVTLTFDAEQTVDNP
jgi:hypothetical protein